MDINFITYEINVSYVQDSINYVLTQKESFYKDYVNAALRNITSMNSECLQLESKISQFLKTKAKSQPKDKILKNISIDVIISATNNNYTPCSALKHIRVSKHSNMHDLITIFVDKHTNESEFCDSELQQLEESNDSKYCTKVLHERIIEYKKYIQDVIFAWVEEIQINKSEVV